MTRYEELKDKAENCRLAAFRAENEEIKKVWLDKAAELEAHAGSLPLSLAEKVVK